MMMDISKQNESVSLTCSNLVVGICKINPILPELMGKCSKGTMCVLYESNYAE